MKFTVKNLLAFTLLAALLISGIVNVTVAKRLNDDLDSNPPFKESMTQLEAQRKIFERALEADQIRKAKFEKCKQALKTSALEANIKLKSDGESK